MKADCFVVPPRNNERQNVQECDATMLNSIPEAGIQKEKNDKESFIRQFSVWHN